MKQVICELFEVIYGAIYKVFTPQTTKSKIEKYWDLNSGFKILDSYLFSWASNVIVKVGEGKRSDEVSERFGLCCDWIAISAFEIIMKYHLDISSL